MNCTIDAYIGEENIEMCIEYVLKVNNLFQKGYSTFIPFSKGK